MKPKSVFLINKTKRVWLLRTSITFYETLHTTL